MKIKFLGAAQETTGSKYLIEHKNFKVLVDCGLYQGHEEASISHAQKFPIDSHVIDAIILTHAHIDHSGYIPALVKQGFKGKIYCSKPTYDLCKILLIDSGMIQEEDAENKENMPPLYTKRDAKHALTFFQEVEYDKPFFLAHNLEITLIFSGHILGSSFVKISDGKKTITFSGDLGRPKQYLLQPLVNIETTDFLVVESTYGNRAHPSEDTLQLLERVIQKTFAKKGVLIIPAFALQRAQIILYLLDQLQKQNRLPDIPIFLDSPMAIRICKVYCNYSDELTVSSHECKQIFSIAADTSTVQESKMIDQLTQPMIIIAGSGMADGGRVLHHFKKFISDAQNTILFVGYQAEDTYGYELVHGAQEITIENKVYSVHAEIEQIETLSAHADYHEILDWLGHFKNEPNKLFVTHGQKEAAASLAEKIKERFNWSVVVPKYLDSFELL